ncbi:MAG: GNAT family N-acetyltransferase [Ardenticatenaceae bacterium]|nr:GNAT family N-acetyltransferase [Ardenticatenaceae bacterium]
MGELEAIFDTFPQLETERCVLREIQMADAEAVFACFNDDEVTRYYDQPTFTDVEQAEKLILHMRQGFRDRRSIRWGIARKEDNWLMGTCGYNGWNRAAHKTAVGYELAQPYWQQGIMTEVLTAVLAFGFQRMKLNRVEALVMPGNVGSEKVLAKLGFQREGLLRQYAYFKEQYYDLQMFALLKAEWLAVE